MAPSFAPLSLVSSRRPSARLDDGLPLSIPAILRRAETLFSTQDGGQPAAGPERRRTHSYAEIAGPRASASPSPCRLGVPPGDRVATLAWAGHQHLEAYLAIPSIGAVLHTLNLRLHPDELAYIVNDAEDRVLIVDESLLPLFEKFREQVNVRARHRDPSARPASGSSRRRRLHRLRAAAGGGRSGRLSRSPPSTNTTRRRCATRRARPAGRKACCTRIARSCCTRSAQGLRDALSHRRGRHGAADRADVPRERVGPAVHCTLLRLPTRSFRDRIWTRRACSSCSSSERVTLTGRRADGLARRPAGAGQEPGRVRSERSAGDRRSAAARRRSSLIRGVRGAPRPRRSSTRGA